MGLRELGVAGRGTELFSLMAAERVVGKLFHCQARIVCGRAVGEVMVED